MPENQLPGAESHQLCGWGRDTAAQGQPGRTLITLLKQVKCIIDFQFVLKARIITTHPRSWVVELATRVILGKRVTR